MPANNNNFDFFNYNGEPFNGLSKEKTTDFDFFYNEGSVFNYLLQPPVATVSVTGPTPKRRIFLID